MGLYSVLFALSLATLSPMRSRFRGIAASVAGLAAAATVFGRLVAVAEPVVSLSYALAADGFCVATEQLTSHLLHASLFSFHLSAACAHHTVGASHM